MAGDGRIVSLRRWTGSRPARGRLLLTCGILAAAALCSPPTRAADAVTEWTLEADRLGGGGANWYTLAVMHMAMHDAAQAVEGRFARWSADPPVPVPPGTSLPAALAGAAAQVLVELHPDSGDEINQLFQSALARLPWEGVTAGLAVGEAIGHATLEHRAADGFDRVRPFRGADEPGRWRPAPPGYATSNTTDVVPFLFAARTWPGERPPPPPGSPVLARDTAEIRMLGGTGTTGRTPAQTEAAEYWAYQSGQRGFVLAAVRELDADGSSDLASHARLMSLMTAAMADAAVLTWAEKEQYGSWRPITVIQGGVPGTAPDPDWWPVIETPPHPEYPSGHASDCFTGAGMLAALFRVSGPFTYVAQSALPAGKTAVIGMGQHAQPGGLREVERRFPSVDGAAVECADSRIWAGAHFRSANEESHRLADAIVVKARTALPPLAEGR